jgi:hypothetical protein
MLCLVASAPVAACYGPSSAQTSAPDGGADCSDVATDSSVSADGTVDAAADVQHDATVPEASPSADARVDSSDASPLHDAHAETSADAGLCPSGSGTIALFGGASTTALGWVSKDGVMTSTKTFAALGVGAGPAVAPFGGGFLVVFPTFTGDVLESVQYSESDAGPAWSTPAAVPTATGPEGALTDLGVPSLAAVGSTGELVFHGSDGKLYDDVYVDGGWGPASEPVGGAGAAQALGPSAPSVALGNGGLYVAWDGQDEGLYALSSPSLGGPWTATTQIVAPGDVGTVPPTMVAMTSHAFDALVVYEDPDSNMHYLVHPAAPVPAEWSTPEAVGRYAFATQPVSMAPLPGGGAVLVYIGEDGHPYASVFTAGGDPAWSDPAPVYTNHHGIASTPTVATGVCGFDAVAAFVEDTVGVLLVTLKGQTWGAPTIVSGTSALAYATVATAP